MRLTRRMVSLSRSLAACRLLTSVCLCRAFRRAMPADCYEGAAWAARAIAHVAIPGIVQVASPRCALGLIGRHVEWAGMCVCAQYSGRQTSAVVMSADATSQTRRAYILRIMCLVWGRR